MQRRQEPHPATRKPFVLQDFCRKAEATRRRLATLLVFSSSVLTILSCAGCGSTTSAPPPPPPATIVLKAAVGAQGNFSAGQTNASYTIIVTNTGNGATIGTVTVADPPTGFTVTAISGTGWTCTLASTTCTRSDALAAGQSFPAITVTGNITAANGTPVTIPVTVSGGGISSPVTVTPTPTVTVAAPVLGISKSHTGNFNTGQQGATYAVTVSNGATAGASNGKVAVTETVPSGETLVSMSGTGWTCPGTAGANTCDRSDALFTGASYPGITVTVNVAANASSPQVNQVNVSGGGMTGSVSANDSTVINIPPTVSLSVSPNPITLGSSASLTWSTTNAASCDASGAWSGTQSTSGMLSVSPASAGTIPYTLTCQSSSGTTVVATAMLTTSYPTPTGPLSRVRSFEYLNATSVSTPGVYSAVANSTADLIVLGVSATSPPLNRALADPSGTKLILGDLNISDAASFWYPSLFVGSTLPSWFGNPNPGFPGLYTVQYWNPAWEPILFQFIDKQVADGYDGMFLDVLNGYLEWSSGNPEGNPVYPNAESAIQTLMSDIRNYILTKYPGKPFYLLGNYTGVLTTGNASMLKDLDAIFNENAYYLQTTGNGFVSAYEGIANAGFVVSRDARTYAATGLPVFGNDYPNPLSDSAAAFLSFDLYSTLGWIPSVQSPSATDAIFSTGPFMFMATQSNSTVTGYPSFMNFLSGGTATNATLIGGNQGDTFIGGPGQNTITGGTGNDTIYAHPKNAAQKGILAIDLASAIQGSGTTPSVSIAVNGKVVLPATPITALYPNSSQSFALDASSYAPISSVVLTVTGQIFTDQNNYSELEIYDAMYDGVFLDLSTGVYSNGSGTSFTPFSGNGTVTYPASSFWVTSPFLSNTSDVIDGGGGTNTVVYRGAYSNYTVTKQPNGSWLVTSKSTAEGPDTLTNIQVLVFSDQQITLH